MHLFLSVNDETFPEYQGDVAGAISYIGSCFTKVIDGRNGKKARKKALSRGTPQAPTFPVIHLQSMSEKNTAVIAKYSIEFVSYAEWEQMLIDKKPPTFR